ncbi:hypothetical protein T492DRAFT_1046478 [Pavlovales sp. CCMP2436]|nr:hypothetical protein T492DRAFT_1046478 [Pavlovales sp. CCMP2436]
MWASLVHEAQAAGTPAACTERLCEAARAQRARRGDGPSGRQGIPPIPAYAEPLRLAMRAFAEAIVSAPAPATAVAKAVGDAEALVAGFARLQLEAPSAALADVGSGGGHEGGGIGQAVEALQQLRWWVHSDRQRHACAYRAALCTGSVAHHIAEIVDGAPAGEVRVRMLAIYSLLDLCRGLADDSFALIWPALPITTLVRLASATLAEAAAAAPVVDEGLVHEQQLAAVRALWQLAFYDAAVDALTEPLAKAAFARLAERAEGVPATDAQASAAIREAALEVNRTLAHSLLRRQRHTPPPQQRVLIVVGGEAERRLFLARLVRERQTGLSPAGPVLAPVAGGRPG